MPAAEIEAQTQAATLPSGGLALDDVLVLLYTCRAHHEKTMAVLETWGADFPCLRVVTDDRDAAAYSANPMFIDVTGRERLSEKSLRMWREVWREHGERVKWVIKVDDDCFLHADNLRAALARLDPDAPHYLGYRLHAATRRHPEGAVGWASGMCICLSRGAFRTFMQALDAGADPAPLGLARTPEDVALAIVLDRFDIRAAQLEGAYIRKDWQRMTPADVRALVVMTELTPRWLHALHALYRVPDPWLVPVLLTAYRQLDRLHRAVSRSLARSPRLKQAWHRWVARLS